MLTPAWKTLRYHEMQAKLWRTDARFVAVAAGRGSGKTELARRRVVRFLNVRKPWSDPAYFYALPTREQAKRVGWKHILPLIPKHWIRKVNITEMSVETVYGSTLYVVGMDRPHRFEGSQYDGGVIDESSDQKEDVFDGTVLPTLSHRNAWCWRIGVPKRFGVGAQNFKEFYLRGVENKSLVEGDDSLRIQSFTWSSEDIVDAATIHFAKMNLTETDYNERYRATWESIAGGIFRSYDDILNIDDTLQYHRDRPIIIGSDFNVNPMAWVIGQRSQHGIDIFDEIWLRNTSTGETLNELYRRYGQHKAGFEFYGDATGRARKTAANSASQSDYIQIKNDTRFHGARVFYDKSNPNVSDRFAATNAMLCNTLGIRRLMIHPRCVWLRKDLQARAYKAGTREPNDSKDIGHITDALGYVVYRLFPLRVSIKDATPRVQVENGR